MLRQLVVVALLVGAVNCSAGDEPQPMEAPQPADAPQPMEAPQPAGPAKGSGSKFGRFGKFANGAVDLSIMGAKHLGRFAQEAKPQFDEFGRAVGKEAMAVGQKIQSHERVKGLYNSIKANVPVEKGAELFGKRVKPVLEQGIQRVKPMVEEGVGMVKPAIQSVIAQSEARQAKLREKHAQRKAQKMVPQQQPEPQPEEPQQE